MSDTDSALCRRLEEAALNAWPAARQLLVDGWVVRLADGYTKRANSATPLYPSQQPAATVAACEQLYAACGLPAIVRLVDFAAPPGLDATLEQRGHRKVDLSLVLHRELEGDAPVAAGPAPREQRDLDAWLDAYYRLSAVPAATRPAHRAIVDAILPHHALFEQIDGGVVAAVGMGVLEGDCFGLFDIVTDPARRGRGHGTALVGGMLAWAVRAGARHAYLQVVAHNGAARRLYARLGFAERYSYWYRIPPSNF